MSPMLSFQSKPLLGSYPHAMPRFAAAIQSNLSEKSLQQPIQCSPEKLQETLEILPQSTPFVVGTEGGIQLPGWLSLKMGISGKHFTIMFDQAGQCFITDTSSYGTFAVDFHQSMNRLKKHDKTLLKPGTVVILGAVQNVNRGAEVLTFTVPLRK